MLAVISLGHTQQSLRNVQFGAQLIVWSAAGGASMMMGGEFLCGEISITPLLDGTVTITPLLDGTVEISVC